MADYRHPTTDGNLPLSDAINPRHYQGFSNGAQLIDISENLTPNAAQAVQYVGRSCRLDGNNKGNTLEDLHKAVWFINREIERLSPAPAERVARAWMTFEEIPNDVEVADVDGDRFIKLRDDAYRTGHGDTNVAYRYRLHCYEDTTYGPFAEVIA